jgi:hypothetical protein
LRPSIGPRRTIPPNIYSRSGESACNPCAAIHWKFARPNALAYNLGNFLRTLATPEPIKDWSLTSLKEKLIKIGAKVVSHEN